METIKILIVLTLMAMMAESTFIITTAGGFALAGLLGLKAALLGGVAVGAALGRRRSSNHHGRR